MVIKPGLLSRARPSKPKSTQLLIDIAKGENAPQGKLRKHTQS